MYTKRYICKPGETDKLANTISTAHSGSVLFFVLKPANSNPTVINNRKNNGEKHIKAIHHVDSTSETLPGLRTEKKKSEYLSDHSIHTRFTTTKG